MPDDISAVCRVVHSEARTERFSGQHADAVPRELIAETPVALCRQESENRDTAGVRNLRFKY